MFIILRKLVHERVFDCHEITAELTYTNQGVAEDSSQSNPAN